MAKKKLKRVVKKTVQDCHQTLSRSVAVDGLIERLASTGEDVIFEAWELRSLFGILADDIDYVWDKLDRLSMRANKPKKTVKLRQVV